MSMRKRRRGILGFSVTEVLAVATMLSTVPMGAYVRAKERGYQTECVHNLQQIGKMIEMYHMENGEYPRAAFYPKDPLKGPDSIRVLVEGVPNEMWICPSLPDQLKKKGLGFVYNDTIGGATGFSNASKKWVMIEINCVSKKAPPPHPQGYNVLFADGHVITTKRLPSKITDAQQARLEQLHKDLMDQGVMVASQ